MVGTGRDLMMDVMKDYHPKIQKMMWYSSSKA